MWLRVTWAWGLLFVTACFCLVDAVVAYGIALVVFGWALGYLCLLVLEWLVWLLVICYDVDFFNGCLRFGWLFMISFPTGFVLRNNI